MNRKIVFDLVRDLVGRGFRQSEVDALDDALDQAENLSQDSVPGVPGSPSRRISPVGIALIKQFEGCASLRSDGLVEAYPDPASGGKPWTIGRSEEHTSELQSLMRISYAVFCLKKKKIIITQKLSK